MLTHILIHSPTLIKIKNQQPRPSPIYTATCSMIHILNHLLIHKSFCNALINSLCGDTPSPTRPDHCTACWLNHSFTLSPTHVKFHSSTHSNNHKLSLQALPLNQSMTDSQRHPSTDLYSQPTPCWFHPYLNAPMQTLHHQLMLPLILWHLPGHRSFHPSCPINYHQPNHPLTHTHHTNMHTYSHSIDHSVTQYIDLSIDWLINVVTKQAHPHKQTYSNQINQQLTPLTLTHTDSLPDSQINSLTCQFTQSHIHTHSHSMHVRIKHWLVDSFT